MDTWVLNGQKWVNETYAGRSGYVPCIENGMTGWSVMHSLTRALQIELGIATPSDTFGAGTLSAVANLGGISATTPNINIRRIVQAALYCKGYSGGGIDGIWGTGTQAGIASLLDDMGFGGSLTTAVMSPKQVKALLTMDAYVLLSGGSEAVRAVQRWLNSRYVGRADFYVVPCDGYFSRTVQKGLMLAVQYAIGMADGVANGNFGPGTKDGLRTKAIVSLGSRDTTAAPFVSLFKAALVFNRQEGVDWGTPEFTADTLLATQRFQTFCRLSVQSGTGDFETWASLLVSTGDPSRAGTACDCKEPLNAARAEMIRSSGYETVGRYITGGTQKRLSESEIQVIFDAGLTFFPIYQEFNNALSYFTEDEGVRQGMLAHDNADALGIPANATVYFSVDFDAVEDEIHGFIIPFFRGVNRGLVAAGAKYMAGIYASRNVCDLVSRAGYAVTSFVSGMSTGFSGNLGFPLPENWAFDQISTKTLGAADAAGVVEIDNNIKSNLDPGIDTLSRPIDPINSVVTWLRFIEARAGEWIDRGHGGTVAYLTAQYVGAHNSDYYPNMTGSNQVFGEFDLEFRDYVNAADGCPEPGVLRCPKSGIESDLLHFGAALAGALYHNFHTDRMVPCIGDFAGWAGDLVTLATQAYNDDLDADRCFEWAYGEVVGSDGTGPHPMSPEDVLADIDAMAFAMQIKGDPTLTVSYLVQAGYRDQIGAQARFDSFVNGRFGSTTDMENAFIGAFAPHLTDPTYTALVEAQWLSDTLDFYTVVRPSFLDNIAAIALGAAAGIQAKFM